MATTGMRYPVAAKMNVEDGTYAAGFVVGKAISFTGTPNNSDVKLYADDGVAESDKAVQDMSVSLNVDDLSLKVQADLLGNTYEAVNGDSPEHIVVSADDVAPYHGLGFYKQRVKNSVSTFVAIWLYKVQFAAPSEDGQTKGESTDFQTPTIEGTAFPTKVTAASNTKMAVYDKAVFNTAQAAEAWLNAKAGIVA